MSHTFRPSALGQLLTGASLLFLLGLPGVVQAAAQGAPQAAHSALRAYDIPAQELAGALLVFGQQSGLQVGAPSPLLAGKQAPQVLGRMSAVQALDRLLAGSGLVWRIEGRGVRIAAPEREAGVLELGNTLVQDRQTPPLGTQVIGRQQIEGLPAGNGDLTSLLKINPNVQFDNAQLSSKTPGEIDPAAISIHGASPWQNLFLVDGMSMNNDLDPDADNPRSATDVPGRSQGLALDTDLLEEVRVMDSNVPASYGGFNGGVVEAITRKPTRELHGKVSVQMARSEWTNYHIDERQRDDFERSTNLDDQPEFNKIITRATLEGHVTDNFGLLVNVSRKESSIPSNLYSSTTYPSPAQSNDFEQTRQIDNYFIKGSWQVNEDWDVDLSLTHAPQENIYFINNTRDSETRIVSGGQMANLKVEGVLPLARLTSNLAWSRLENSRETGTDYFRTWRWSTEKDWTSTVPSTGFAAEGSWGAIEQQQESIGYKLQIDWNRFQLLGMQHSLQTGLELASQQASYERLHDLVQVYNPAGTNSCQAEDPYCSLSGAGSVPSFAAFQGQYLRTLKTYRAGSIEFDTRSWGVYLQDEIKYQRLTLRPGVRLDGDDYLDQQTVSPRFMASLDVFGDGSTTLTGGANRYYGRNLSAYRLYEGRNALEQTQTRTSSSAAFGTPTTAVNNTKLNELDVPYDDEVVFGIDQLAFNTLFSLKYVKRNGEDGVVKTQGRYLDQPSTDTSELAANYYTFANLRSSETETLTFTVRPLQSLELWGSRSHMELALDWTDSRSSHVRDGASYTYSSYGDAMSEAELEDAIIRYEGKFIKKSERPAQNYNRPWTARLMTDTAIPLLNLKWNNLLRYRDGYRKIADTGDQVSYEGELVDVWEKQDFSSGFAWDTRVSWELPTGSSEAVFVNLDVTNVLDEVIVSSADSNDIPTYEVGRQFMVEVGYRF